jgi:hypothetical protein
MNNQYNKNQLTIGRKVYDLILPFLQKDFESNLHIFLVGAALEEKKSVRSRINTLLYDHPRMKIHYPENIFVDLMEQDEYDLLSLENLLANSVDAVVMCVESPGSLVELGAFSNNDKLNNKLIVLMNEEHRKAESFINKGPIKYLKRKKSSVQWINYQGDIIKNYQLKKWIVKKIRDYKKDSQINISIKNPLITEKYLLTILYVFGSLERKNIIRIIKEIIGNEAQSEIDKIISIVDASLGILKSNEQIYQDGKEIYLSDKGINRVWGEFDTKFIQKKLDSVRFKVLNLQYRKYWGFSNYLD